MAITTAALIAGLIKFATYTAISVGVNLVANALRKKPKRSTDSLDFEQTVQRRLSNGLACEVLTGRRITAGVGFYDNSYGPDLQYGVSISVMSAKPCTAFHRLFLDGEPVDLSGDPTQGEVNVISHFLGISDTPRVKVRVFLGDDNSGIGEYLAGKFPSQWTADDDFGDYCVVVVQAQNTNDDLDEDSGTNYIPFQGFPDFKVELSGVKVCDPRVAGADYADETTYVYSNNPALIDAQIDFGWYSGVGAGRSLLVGNGYPVELMDLAQIIANANYCDTEEFTCAGLIRSGQNDDQAEVWKCYNAERVEHAAKVFSIPEGNRQQITAIDMSEYPAAYVSSYDPNGFSTEVYNEIKTVYSEPEEYYGEKDLPLYSDPAWVAADNHIPRQMSLPLLFVTDKVQAAKLQKQEINMSRSPATVTIEDFPYDFIEKPLGSVVVINGSDISEINGREWIIKGRGQTERGDVSLILREYGGTQTFAFDAATETPTVPIQVPAARPWPWFVNGEYISAEVIAQVDEALDGIDTSVIRENLFSVMLRLDELRRNTGELGTVRGRPIETAFTETETLIQNVDEQLVTVEETLTSALDDNAAIVDEFRQTQATQNTATAQLISQLRADLGQAQANIINLQNTTVDSDQALAEQINALQASLNGNIANIVTQLEALATADRAEATARSLLEARVDDAFAEIAEERRVRTLQDDAAAVQRNIILAQVNQNSGAIVVTQTALADLDSATTETLQQQQAQIANAQANLETERTTRVNQYEALAQEDLVLRARLTDIESGQSGLASQINSFEARVRSTEQGIISVSSQLNGVAAQASDAQGRALGNASSINSLASRVTQTESSIVSQSQSLNQVTASVAGLSSQVSILSQAQSDGQVASGALVFRIVSGGNVAEIQTAAGSAFGSAIRLSADQIQFDGDVIVNGSLTAEAFEGEGISINQTFTGNSVNISSTGAYTRVYSSTLRTSGKRVTVVGYVDVSLPLYNGGQNVAVWMQLRVGGIVRRTTYWYVPSGWPHTLALPASFTPSGNSAIEVWVRVMRNTAQQGLSGARTLSTLLMAQEMKA